MVMTMSVILLWYNKEYNVSDFCPWFLAQKNLGIS